MVRSASQQYPAGIDAVALRAGPGVWLDRMSALPHVVLAFLLIAPAYPASGQTDLIDPGGKEICAQVQDVELPAAHRPGPEERSALAGCVSQDLYFGLGQAADPVKARKCAYMEEEANKGLVFGGRTMLMMIYANGRGAPRDLDLALKLACEQHGSPSDVAGNIHELARFKKAGWTGQNFSVCDHSSGRYMYEQCAMLQERLDQVAREKALAGITARWSAGDRAVFQSLREAASTFFAAHAGEESDLEATHEVQERAALEDEFVASLGRLEQGGVPEFSADDLREAEAAMTAAYTRIEMGTVRRWGTATWEGIRVTQDAWIAYRDAWVAFGKQRYPAVSAESWKTLLTRRRVAMLDFFLH